MKRLEGLAWPYWHFAELKKVRDLLEYDGPLLTHFEHKNGDDYLFYWVDCDDQVNRWMVLRVDEASILRMVNRVVPVDFVIPKLCRDDFVLFIDTPDGGAPKKTLLVETKNIPAEYLPKAGAWLPASPAVRSKRSYAVLVEGGWGVHDLGDFPNVFSKAYSLLYGLNVLNFSRLNDFPWRGGFSAMHFFNWAFRAIPSEDKPLLAAIVYQSPGFMRFKLHGPTADEVGWCVKRYKENNDRLAAAYGSLTRYITDNGLIAFEDPQDPIWPRHDPVLAQGAIDILAGFDVVDAQAFVSVCARPFEAAQISRAFYRYVRDLVMFEKRSLVRFPEPPRPIESPRAVIPPKIR